METDRNLLFGVLALQLDLIDAQQLADACSVWVTRKGVPLANVFAERGWLTPDDRAEVERLVERKLRKHGGDVHQSLIAVADATALRALADVPDPDVQNSLADPNRPGGHVLLSTIAYQPEARERYTLTRIHAKGGIGQVWLARDADLGRDVALKELRPERAGNPAIWSRFLEEARITGQLEHPNIVPVHELVTPTGSRQPFYTMRFVKGRTLAEAAGAYHQKRAQGSATPVEFQSLLNAFLGVCNAVAYAHSRGVIHRDLKGQNVVLGDYGEVIVLDWGLAKLVDRPEETLTPQVSVDLKEDRGETIQGQALGTPGYMAPEQALGQWNRVGQRSDVYGLGAILYEILTGRPPFLGDETASVLRKVVEEPPDRPCAVCPSTPKALEAICLKALAKDPADRYTSARALADDIRHYLADESISAARDPLTVRLGRWARRHRPLVASAAALLLTALTGLTIGAVLLGRANTRIEEQRRLAEANFRQARAAVDEYFTKVSESTLLNVPGLQPLRKELLESARKYYQNFLRDHATDREVRAETAEAWYRVGFVTMDIGSKEEAASAFEKAASMYEILARDHPDEPRYPYKLAMSLNDLGNQQAALGRSAEALKTHDRALEIRQAIARDHPENPEYQKELAIGYLNRGHRRAAMGQPIEALDAVEQARAILDRLVREHPDVADYRNRLAGTYNAIGYHLHQMDRVAEAVDAHQRAIALLSELVKRHPDVADYRSHLAGSHSEIGFLRYRLLGQPEEAQASYQHARELLERLVEENPAVTSYRVQLGYCDNHMGRIATELGRMDEAREAHERARAIREALVREHPTIPWYRNALAYTLFYLGELHEAAGRRDQAVASLVQARTIWEELARTETLDPYNLSCILALCSELSGIEHSPPEASDLARKQQFADRAVAVLRQSISGGFHNAEMIEKDSDFDAIRTHPDYQALMAELRLRAGVKNAAR